MVRLYDLADVAVLVEVESGGDVLGLFAGLTDDREAGRSPTVEDIVPAERTIMVRFDPRMTGAGAVRAWIEGAGQRPAARRPGALVEVPVRYDGEDLDEIARITGLGRAGVVAAHTGRDWTVAFTGFVPGFGYLMDGDARLRVPRRSSPRTVVPAGAVALAGAYSGIYPRPSPGGWQLIGTALRPVWDLDRDPPALLRPGDRVRFLAAT